MKQVLYFMILLSATLPMQAMAQDAPIFPKGEKSPNVHHTGNVWLNELNHPDSIFNFSISVATFDAGAILDWHTHPSGQILLITAGIGYYQEKGKPKQTFHKGEVIKCLPGVEHWHGATPESGFTYLATTPTQKGKTVWLQKVTDEEYYGKKPPAINNTNTEQEIINLSKDKWQWMADKNVDKLSLLFHDESKFVHMGGTWKKKEEIDIIKTGSIWYKKADVHDVAVEIVDDIAVLWNRITLTAMVRDNEVVTEFTVTEVYKKQGNDWKLLALTFSSVRDTHQIAH